MRLSRSAWNNVIIFSIMGFILLINITQRSIDDVAIAPISAEQSIIGDDVILTLSIDQQVTIERIGQSWQMRPKRLSPQMLEQMMRSWHQSTGQIVELNIDRKNDEGLFVSAALAGQQKIHLFTLYLIEQQLIVLNHQTGHYLALPQVMFNQLIPTGLLK